MHLLTYAFVSEWHETMRMANVGYLSYFEVQRAICHPRRHSSFPRVTDDDRVSDVVRIGR